MQGINKNQADSITFTNAKRVRGEKEGVSVQHGFYKSRAIVSYDF